VPKLNLLLAIAALVVGVAVTAVALAQDEGQPDRATVATRGGELDAFSRPRTSDDILPAVAANEVQAVAPGDARVTSSVEAAGLDDRSVYLVPATDAVCLILWERSLGASVSCPALMAVNDGAATPSYVKTGCGGPPPDAGPPVCGGLVLYGVVPNGIDEVTVESASRVAIHVAVSDNAFLVERPMPTGAISVRYVGPDGGTVRLPVPL
jgi:hypothetical protein